MHPNLVMCFLKLIVIQYIYIYIYVYLNACTCSTWKKKVKNKVHVETSICEVYIIEEISIFISYCFKPHMRTRINHVPIQ